MSIQILAYIVNIHKIDIEPEGLEAAWAFMDGQVYEGFPSWLGSVVCNRSTGIDMCKLDSLSRDINHTMQPTKFEYDRLIINCRVVNEDLSWKMCEMSSIEYLFFNRISGDVGLADALTNAEEFVKLDDRLLYRVEKGQYGEAAQAMAMAIRERKLYRFIGEIHVNPQKDAAETYSQRPSMGWRRTCALNGDSRTRRR
jgi:hypothetical protein